MGLTRFYKTEGILHLSIYIKSLSLIYFFTLHIKNELTRSWLSNVRALQTDTQIDATKCISTPY